MGSNSRFSRWHANKCAIGIRGGFVEREDGEERNDDRECGQREWSKDIGRREDDDGKDPIRNDESCDESSNSEGVICRHTTGMGTGDHLKEEEEGEGEWERKEKGRGPDGHSGESGRGWTSE